MIDERIIELYRSQLAAANEEKGMLYAQIKALTEEVSMLRLSMEQSKQATNEFLSEIKSLHDTLKLRTNVFQTLRSNCPMLLNLYESGSRSRKVVTDFLDAFCGYISSNMANSLMKKAVTYMLNQWESLRNFILDGRVQLSNNLCEQRMKPIKLNLKVCQNIGSETAAENASFMFSLMESCKLNKLKEEPYMEMLFNSLCMEQVDWKQNLPCFYKQ